MTVSGPPRLAVLNLGFRPFFLLAGTHAVFAIAVWAAILSGLATPALTLPAPLWHAHEMIFGYTMAVIAGFLLTAARNWTNLPTLEGNGLLAAALLWLIARIASLAGPSALPLAAIADLLFVATIVTAAGIPVVRTRLWHNLAVILKVLLIGACNAVFYAGALGWIEDGMRLGLYSGLYLVIALILTMLRRLIPFFTERGVGYPVTLTNRRWLDISSMFLFLAFWILEVFMQEHTAAAAAATVLFALHLLRLSGWYTPGIRKKALLWSLHAGYAFIVTGFALHAAAVFTGSNPFLSGHAFAFGGIGVITLSMMARVALGHTGRSVHEPPPAVTWILLLLCAGAVVRIFVPLLLPGFYLHWITLANMLWLAAFAWFTVLYAPMLWSPRPDGAPG
jgi:uncharacterized protein involved in response to NO